MKPTTPKLSDLLKTLKDHPWQHVCPVCKKDCGKVAMVKLVYRWTECSCDFAPYTHLVEKIYHADCYGR